jgi:predicted TIM-barrel fold metal-dependent hydrolase
MAKAPPPPATPSGGSHYIPVREDWLALYDEPALEPDLPIIDPHHHLWERQDWTYMLPDLLADCNAGHNIIGTVFVQCRSMHRASGPEEMKPIGETEFVNGVAAMSASGGYGKTVACAGIVSFADMFLGEKVKPVLEAHIAAGNGRFRGIRHIVAWDPDPEARNPAYQPGQHALLNPTFQAGLRQLAPLNLTFEAWLYHPQIPDVTKMARAIPELNIVLNHIGGPLGINAYAGKRDEVFADWNKAIRELATCPNVTVKVGGMAMRLNGYDFHQQARPPSAQALADAWKPYVDTCVEAFGANRCMFESNFPVDKGSYSYSAYWNACKLLSKGASADEKRDLFAGTANRFYRLGLM